MDVEELVSILQDKFSGIDRQVIRAVLDENDNRLAAAEEALRAIDTRSQDSRGAGPSGRARNGGIDEKDVQMRRDEMLARQMQAHSFGDTTSRGYGNGGGGGGGGGGGNGSYGGSGGSYGASYPGSGDGNLGDADAWTDTLYAVSTSVEQNLKIAVNYASSLSSWASTLIANLDPTSILFENDDEYEGPLRPLPDKTKDQEGVTVTRSARVTQRPRNVGPVAPRSPTASEIEAAEEEYEEEPLDFSSPVAAVTAVTAWLGGEDEEIKYSKKDK